MNKELGSILEKYYLCIDFLKNYLLIIIHRLLVSCLFIDL